MDLQGNIESYRQRPFRPGQYLSGEWRGTYDQEYGQMETLFDNLVRDRRSSTTLRDVVVNGLNFPGRKVTEYEPIDEGKHRIDKDEGAPPVQLNIVPIVYEDTPGLKMALRIVVLPWPGANSEFGASLGEEQVGDRRAMLPEEKDLYAVNQFSMLLADATQYAHPEQPTANPLA